MNKIWSLYFLFLPITLYAAESPRIPRQSKKKQHVKIEIPSRPGSEVEDEVAERLLLYFLGDRPGSEIRRAFSARLQKIVEEEPEIQQTIEFIETSSTEDADDGMDVNRLKKMLLEVVTEAVEEKHLEAAEATLQLSESDKRYRTEKYKFYAATATALTSLCGVGTAFLAYNVS